MTTTPELRDAYATCLRVARGHYENFPVASWLVPAKQRPHIAAIYAFARIADDVADEPGRTNEERLNLLETWGCRLHGRPGHSPVDADLAPVADAVFEALRDTIDRFHLPVELFDDLLSAFAEDVHTSRYHAWADVLDYCRRSANPVGRLVLRVFGYRRDELDASSDALCTALQLTNFWQDLASDWSRGRLYVPGDVWRSHRADPSALSARRLDEAWRATLADTSQRTRRLFDAGRTVCEGVSGRLRYELRATWLGGTRILDRLEQNRFDVFDRRPTLGAVDAIVIGLRTVGWTSMNRERAANLGADAPGEPRTANSEPRIANRE